MVLGGHQDLHLEVGKVQRHTRVRFYIFEGGNTGIGEVAHMVEQEIVDDYKKVEDGVVGGFNKIADGFVDKFLKKEGETVEEARERLSKEQEKRLEKAKAYGDPAKSLEKSQSDGYKGNKK